MTTSGDDGELRARFAALREEDRAAAPRFGASPAAGSRPRPWLGWGIAAAAVVGTVAVWWIGAARTTRAPVIDLSRAVWVAPTDFLLETPGRDLLRRGPQIEAPKVF